MSVYLSTRPFNHGSSDLRRWPYGDRQVPRAPLPVTSVTRGRVAVQRHLEERYPFFIAPTSSCAKPASSSGLRVSTLISRGPGRLLRAPAGNWFFPTLSLPVFARMLEPLLPSGGRVHLPVTSPNLVGLPQTPPMGRLPRIAPQRDFVRRVLRDRRYSLRSGLLVCSPPRSPLPLRSFSPHRAAVTFTPEQSPAPLPVQASGC